MISPDASPPDERVLSAALTLLERGQTVVTPSTAVAERLRAAGMDVQVCDIAHAPAGRADAVALLADELSTAGEHAEGLVAAAVAAARPGGMIVVSALSQVALQVRGGTGRGFLAADLRRALGHHGIDVSVLCAPGAAGAVAGTIDAPFDPQLDRTPGLLDAAPRIVAAGRTARSGPARSAAFFSTLPYKVVAAAVVCRDREGRLLVVHDSFKRHWTIPGGVVDADEDPREAAEREAWEEAGVRVRAGTVLGVFSASWPDRVVLVYEASPIGDVTPGHQPVHAHEIDAVDWWPVDAALTRLARHVAQQVRHCLEHPGGTLRQGWA